MADDGSAASRQAALEEIAEDPACAAMLAFWQAHSEGGTLPKPQAIHPTAFPASLLPKLVILDVIDGPRFRVRLMGTGLTTAFGVDFTGRFLDEAIPEELLVTAREHWCAAVAHRRPVYAYAEYRFPDRPSIKNRILMLPLSSDGSIVDRILIVFSPKSERLAREAVFGLKPAFDSSARRSYVIL